MIQIISKEAIEERFSMEALESYGLAGATIAGGVVVGNIINTLVNKARKKDEDSIIVSGAMAVGGLAGAMLIPNKWAKFACLGVMTYGVVKSAAIGVKEVTAAAPADATVATHGLAGLLPESIKAKLRGYIPNIGSVDQLIGDEQMNGGGTGSDTDFGFLDEPINGDEEIKGTEDFAAIGSVEAQLM